MNKMLCTNCGEQSYPKTFVKGSGILDISLWIIFIMIALWFGGVFWGFLIIPLIHSLWRSSSRYKACPKCKTSNMVGLDSPIAQQIFKGQEKEKK